MKTFLLFLLSFMTIVAETPTEKFEKLVVEKYDKPTKGHYDFLLSSKLPQDCRMVKSLKGLPILFKVKPENYKATEFIRYKGTLQDSVYNYLVELRKGYPKTQRAIWDTEFIYFKIRGEDSPLEKFFDEYLDLYWINEWYKTGKPTIEYVYEGTDYYQFFCSDQKHYRIKR